MAAFFKASVSEFLETNPSEVLHKLHREIAAEVSNFQTAQHGAWEVQLPILASQLKAVIAKVPSAGQWGIFLEYSIPGRRKRLDCVVLTERVIVPIEFKVGASDFPGEDRWQLKVYSWNLRDFHKESRGRTLAPILVATAAERSSRFIEPGDGGQILRMQLLKPTDLAEGITHAYAASVAAPTRPVDIEGWNNSQTEATESILEAAQRLFGSHDVREIKHAHGDKTDEAVGEILRIVRDAREHSKRSICFITGVPGSGKTLVGLRAAYSPAMKAEIGGAALFASGNVPLIKVLTKALELNRTKQCGTRRAIGHAITAPFENVHRLAAIHLNDPSSRPPSSRVVIFDEAQRVWTRQKVYDAQKKRKHRQGDFDKLPETFWNRSEPDLLLEVMQRHTDWCVVVALVGGGQEIHDGEAGLAEWGKALKAHASYWTVWSSPIALKGGATMAGQTLFDLGDAELCRPTQSPLLHLSVSKRSMRAERLTEWVDHVLKGESEHAAKTFKYLGDFPITLVRELRTAKSLIRRFGGAESRFGLFASSEADRLRAEGIEVSMEFRRGIDFPEWFVRPEGNIRSSNQLEVAATEFECQGLELDWTCVCWGNDFAFDTARDEWSFWKLWGTALRSEADVDEQTLTRNVYRVLLTRAREGVILFVPHGDEVDSTRRPALYNGTVEFLKRCGVPEERITI